MSKAKARAKKAAEKKPNILLFNSHTIGKYSGFNQYCQGSQFTLKLTEDNGHKKKGAQIRFFNVIQFVMYHKAILFKNYNIATQILINRNPRLSVAFGEKVGIKEDNWDQDVWDEAKFKIATDGNYLKFSQNDRIKALLLSTNDSIIAKADPADSVWGIGIGDTHINAPFPEKWSETGLNLLGKILMEIRFQLRKKLDPSNVKIARTAYPGISDSSDYNDIQDQVTIDMQEAKREDAIKKLSQNFNINPDDL